MATQASESVAERSSAAGTESSRRPTTVAGLLYAIAAAVEERGLDPAVVFEAAGIERPPTNNPLARVPTSTIGRVMAQMVQLTGDPLIGLDVGRFMSPTTAHALGLSLLVSHDLRDFGVRLARYFRLGSSAVELRFLEREDCIGIAASPGGMSPFEAQDAGVYFVTRLIRSVSGERCRPRRVLLCRPAPPDGGSRHREMLGCDVEFAHTYIWVEYELAALDIVFQGGSRELAEHNDAIVVDYLARLDRSDIESRVKSLLIEELPSGGVSKTRVAAKLNMSPRTLQHKLSERGTNFHDMVNELRRDLACAYLENSALPVAEIADRLGFSDTSNFSRAFKRLTGRSPRDFRGVVVVDQQSAQGSGS